LNYFVAWFHVRLNIPEGTADNLV